MRHMRRKTLKATSKSAMILMVVTLTLTQSSAELTTSSFYIAWKGKLLTSHEASVGSRSRLECMNSCVGFSHCHSAAFDVTSNTCYLHPVFDPDSDAEGAATLKVFTRKAPACQQTKAPPLAGGRVAQWHHTLTSFQGDVTCDANFIYSGDDATLRCLPDGQWEMDGECKQHIWTDATLHTAYRVPRPVEVGWQMCMTGVPDSGADRFTLNVYDDYGNRLMMSDFRFHCCGTSYLTVVDNHVNGRWGPYGYWVRDPPFPFTHGQRFQLSLIADSEYLLSLHVDGTFYASLQTPVSITTITKVQFLQKVTVEYLDVWCM
ncbi:hypothetical protein BaRGS_00007184 [Batillaria attramentaria]|uniref:Galectin n=1 Tax=Batillaria attramentaria TaxID=370345 RepID=A0ABD0LRS4_9CAEN